MKIALSALAVLGGLQLAASSFLLRSSVRRSLLEGAQPPELLVASNPLKTTVKSDAAFSIATDGGDYHSKAFTGENIGDPRRGNGNCVAFRRTLQCNPSGIRDPKKDKGCTTVVTSEESGFCECGDYAQFAAVDCNHRPFTCEVMCLKFAMLSGKAAVYRGSSLSPVEIAKVTEGAMWSNQTDLQAMHQMIGDVQDYMTRAMQYTNETSANAVASMQKFMDMMKNARQTDADLAAAELAKYHATLEDKPWLKIWNNGKKLEKTGQAIQAKVREVLPFDPVQDSTNNALAWAMSEHGR